MRRIARRNARADARATTSWCPRSACPACGHKITADGEHPRRVVARVARQVLGLRRRDFGPVPAGRAPWRIAGGRRHLSVRADVAGPRRVRVPVDAARADVHRFRHAAPAGQPHAALAVGRPPRQSVRALRAAARGGDRRHRRLPDAVDDLLAVQDHPRQGRDGLRRFQAARRARRVAGVEDASADRAGLIGRRRVHRHRPRRPQGPRPQRSAGVRPVSRDCRDDRAVLRTNRSSRSTSRADRGLRRRTDGRHRQRQDAK